MSLINGILWAVLRRWYGGGFDEKYKWLGNRGLQTAVMIIAIFIALYDRTIWWAALLLAVWIQFQFWSRAVGEILDCGRSTVQTAESYDRWFRVPLDWVYDKLGKVKYTGAYDWWYGWLRYGLPMIVPAVVLCCFPVNLNRFTPGGMVITYCVICFLLWTYQRLPQRILSSFLMIGRNTLPILLFSPLFTILSKSFLPFLAFDPTGMLFLCLATAFTLAGSLGIAWVMDRCRVSRWFCGKEKMLQ